MQNAWDKDTGIAGTLGALGVAIIGVIAFIGIVNNSNRDSIHYFIWQKGRY